MRVSILVILYLVSCLPNAFGQFSTNIASQPVNTTGNYGSAYLSDSINVFGLGNLDGVSSGVTSVDVTISITSAFNLVQANLQLYLVAPNGNLAVMLTSNVITPGANKLYSFNLNPGTTSYTYGSTLSPGTYKPAGNFNSLNLGQSANGYWKLYILQKNPTVIVTVNKWSITFGNINLSPGSPNQTFATALPLTNTTTTGGGYISGNSNFTGAGIGLNDAKEVGDNDIHNPHTEKTVWYSFVPTCKNDRIQITGSVGYIYSGLLNSTRTILQTYRSANLSDVYTYPYANYVPGATYYLKMDSDQTDAYQYEVRWFKGDVGCNQPPTITTINQDQIDFCEGTSININFTIAGTFNSGNRFTAQLSDTLGSFTNPQVLGFNDATTPSVINGILPAGLKPGKSYKIRVVASNPFTIGSANSGITVKGPPATPITLTGKNPVCSGEKNIKYSVSTVSNATKYTWKFTGGTIIAGGNTGDSSVVLVNFGSINSNVSVSAVNECGSSGAYQKNITITQPITPTISIDPVGTNICQGDSVRLQSSFTNEGTDPVFRWKINNQNYESSAGAITIKNLKDKDSVLVTLTSSQTCITTPEVRSDKLLFTVKDTVKPSINILGGNQFCKGDLAFYHLDIQNSGPHPTFTWFVNHAIQNNYPQAGVYSSDKFKNKDSIWVTMESDAACARPAKVTSPKLTLTVFDTIRPVVNIAGPVFSCKGQNITLEAKNGNGGSTPSFTWLVNGAEQNANSLYLSGKNFKNGDSFVVKLQSSLQCAVPKTVFSNTFNLSVYDTIKPVITLITDTVFCLGQPVTIASKIENGGSNPEYSWICDDREISQEKDFSSDLPVGDHTLTGTVTSSENCAFPASSGKTIIVTVRDTVKIHPIITGDTILCEGSEAFFRLINPDNTKKSDYNWIVNGTLTGKTDSILNINGLTNGTTISLNVSGNEKCAVFLNSNTLHTAVTTAMIPDVKITASATEACPGQSILYKSRVTNPGTNETYSWIQNNQATENNTDSLITTINAQTSVNLHYSATLICGTFNGTFSAPSVQIKESAPFLLSISGPDTYCADDEALRFSTNKVENAMYEWKYPSYLKSSEKGNSIIISFEGNTKPDTLKVRARNVCGEGNEVSLPLNPENCTTLFIPNAILSSDETGNNLWKIKGIENYPGALVMVFNRWGMKVFSSLGYTEAWDGTIRGKELPTGTYYYVIEGIENKPLTGALTIVH